MEYFKDSDIDYVCNKISKKYETDKNITPYIDRLNIMVKTFLSNKQVVENFDLDMFANHIINNIENRKVKSNTHVGVLAAQSIGEPVTQSALSYFHKLTGDADSSNGLKELYNVTHNKLDYSVAEFFLTNKDPDSAFKKKVLNSMKYTTLNDVVLDVVYDGFTLRLYLCKHTIFKFRMHPKTIYEYIKNYLKKTNNILSIWESSFNLANLYIEFSQPSSKLLDWLDEHQVEYLVDADMLCVFKPKLYKNNNIKKSQEANDNTNVNGNHNGNNNINGKDDIDNNKNNDVTNKLELPKLVKENFITTYFINNKLSYEEKDKYYMLDSDYVNLNKDDIIKLLNNIVLTGTKGVVNVIPKYLKDEFYIEVTGTNLDPLFNNIYIDKCRSRYLVYSNSMDIDFELRKENILMQLQRIVNVDSSSYNQQHIELLTNFMCRKNEEVTPMSRFGMKNNNYSFISQLSFEDPYSVIQDVVYGAKDSLTSISSKLITGMYDDDNNDDNLTSISSKLITGISNENNDNHNENDTDNNIDDNDTIDNINENDNVN